MCGISGFWQNKPGDEPPTEILNRMGATLVHRGPDDSDAFHDSASGVGLAFRRLAIIDLTKSGNQPMASASGRFVIVFNGEVYNFEEIRAELGPRAWRSRCDTEVMLEAIERWGVEPAVQRFVRMFAFALWDRGERRLFLARDRVGIKPLYYGHINGSFVFASELKAIQQFPGFRDDIDRDALALYMRHNYVPAPHSIYSGIYKLQAGHILSLRSAGGLGPSQPFWSAAEVARAGLHSPFRGDEREAIDQLEEKLATAVRMRLISDVPLGAFLSGGIDSSTVVALMQSQTDRPVKTFTIGFHEDAYDEAHHAKRIADHLGTEHTELYVTPQAAMDVVPLLPSMFDEPFADLSEIPTCLVSKLARLHVTVALSGDGGDELFGGYDRYSTFRSLWRVVNAVPGPLARVLAGRIHVVSPDRLDRWLRLVPLPLAMRPAPGRKLHRVTEHLLVQDPIDMYLSTLSNWPDPGAIVPGSREPDTVSHAIASFRSLPSPTDMAMLTDLTSYLPDDILTKVDRARHGGQPRGSGANSGPSSHRIRMALTHESESPA